MAIEHQRELAVPCASGSGKVRPGRPRLRLLAVGAATLLGAMALSVGLAPASRVGADIIIDPTLPTDPTTVPTTVPDTTPPTTAPATTTTTAPPTTTTTRPPVITTRPTTTTTRATTTTSKPATRSVNTGGTGTSVATGTSTSAGVRVPAARRKVLAAKAKAKQQAIKLRDASPLPDLTPTKGGLPVDVAGRVIARKKPADGAADVTQLNRRTTTGSAGGNSLMTYGLILAGALLLGVLAWRVIAGRRRAPRSAYGAPMFVDRDATEIEVRAALITLLAEGPIDVSGSDCRALQMLVKVAALEGLEIRDPEGYVPRASERLVAAFGFESDRKRLPLHWRVTVGHRSVAIPDGAQYLMQETGPAGLGRRLAFSPGTPLDLWDGDCL